jgi:hypothetical protein
MAQVSRPYQIALAALVLVAAVWFFALHRPGSGPGSSPSSPSAAAPAASSNGGGSPSASTPVYHGAAPGVEGLSRAIDKAHGAVATSQQNAKELQDKSAQASESTPSGASAATSSGAAANAAPAGAAVAAHHAGASAAHQTGASTTVVHRSATKTSTTTVHRTVKTTPSHASTTVVANAQAAVLQSELKRGQTVLLLFWNPKSSDDVSVRHEAQAVAAHMKGKVALHVALAAQVGQYGAVTRGVQVLQTPTLLLIDKKGLAVTLTGLLDQYAIEQGILEAQHGSTGT